MLFTNVGFSISDTTAIGIAARNFFATSKVNDLPATIENVSLYPNPVNDLISIELNMKSKTNVTINLLDVSGKLIREIANEEASSGSHKINSNLSGIPSGVYTVQILSDGKSINKRITIAH